MKLTISCLLVKYYPMSVLGKEYWHTTYLEIKHSKYSSKQQQNYPPGIIRYCSILGMPFLSIGSIPAKLDSTKPGRGTWNRTE